MPEIVHNIDLSSVPHRPGQSTDLESKRQRAWNRLSDEEKEWVLTAWDLTGMVPSAPAFRELNSAGDRVLYVLVGTEESLTPLELCYLMIARWFRNIDPATARAKIAQLVSQGSARYTGIGRTMATEAGLERLEDLAQENTIRRPDDDELERPDHRTTTSKSRVVDRGESPRSNFGNRSAPTGRYRSEIPDDGGRAPQRSDREPARDNSGGSGRDDRAPRRDDRGGDSRAPREERDGEWRGPRRDDRGREFREPRRDDRGDDSRGPRRDDRGGYSGGPRRDDRGSDSRGPRSNDRSSRSERGRVNLDGPRIDGKGGNRPEPRVNLDGPRVDGKGEDRPAPKPERKGPQRDEHGRFISKPKSTEND